MSKPNNKKKHQKELKRKRRRKEARVFKQRKKEEENKPKVSDKKGIAHSIKKTSNTGEPIEAEFNRSAWGLDNGEEDKKST